MDPLVRQAELDGVDIGDRRLAAGDVDRVAGRTERRNEFAERRTIRAKLGRITTTSR